MAEFPALPLFTDAYLADTRHLTTLQHGAYLLLLMEAWRRPNTSLPDDDALLAKLAGVSAPDWDDMKPTIMEFWHLDARTKTWSQKRLSDEKIYVKKKGKAQRSNAKARWGKDKTPSHGNATEDAKDKPTASQTDAPTPTPTPTPTKKENNLTVIQGGGKKKKGSATRLTDDWEPSEATIAGLYARGFTEEELRKEFERFKNYWISRAGKDATKHDWDRTFINRMLDVREWKNERRN